MTLDPGRTALLVIDVQNDYWRPPREPRLEFLDTLAELLDFARATGITVIHVRHSGRPEKGRFVAGTPGFEIREEVAPRPDERRVVKTTPGSFYNTELERVLREGEVVNLIVSGIQTQKCCDTTTREASARGFKCFFVADAVETFDLVDHLGVTIDRDEIARATFATLHNGFAEVVSLADLRERFAAGDRRRVSV